MESLKYPNDTMIVNMPPELTEEEKDDEFLEDVTEELYVYAGFFKPGKLSLVIRDEDYGLYSV